MFINHSKTNMHLAVHDDWTLRLIIFKVLFELLLLLKHILFTFISRTAFGREFEVTSCTKWNEHKFEDHHNHFMVVTREGYLATATTSTTTNTNDSDKKGQVMP